MCMRWALRLPRRIAITPSVAVTRVTTESTCSRLRSPLRSWRIANEEVATKSMALTQNQPTTRWAWSPLVRRRSWYAPRIRELLAAVACRATSTVHSWVVVTLVVS